MIRISRDYPRPCTGLSVHSSDLVGNKQGVVYNSSRLYFMASQSSHRTKLSGRSQFGRVTSYPGLCFRGLQASRRSLPEPPIFLPGTFVTSIKTIIEKRLSYTPSSTSLPAVIEDIKRASKVAARVSIDIGPKQALLTTEMI